MNFRLLLSLNILICLSFTSCLKHETLVFKSHSITTSDELTSVYFWDELNGIAVGGNIWSRGLVCRTHDGGINWKVDSIFDKEIFCMTPLSTNGFLAMGIELNVYELKDNENLIHKIKHVGNFRFIRGVSAFDADHIIAVHGFANGSIEKISLLADSTKTVLNISRDLNAIQCLDSLHWLVCGFGIVLRSQDAGEHWDTLDIFGDHFIDISLIPPATVYLLGTAGTVYKSSKLGLDFKELKSGGIIGDSPVFSCIAFRNSQEGIIAGDEGHIMITRNGGSSWTIVDGLPIFDIKNVYCDGTHYWLCGSSGTIISFNF